jgi:hypothetical protein
LRDKQPSMITLELLSRTKLVIRARH